MLKFALWIVGTAHVTATIVTSKSHLNPDLSDKTTGTWMFHEATFKWSASKIDCAILCMLNTSCVSFAFHSVRKVCKFYAATITKYNGLVNDPGYVTYHTSKASRAFGAECTSSSDCLLANSDCINHTCQCVAGLSYLPNSLSCVVDCPELGKEYTPFPAYYMADVTGHKYNDSKSMTVEGCASRCFRVKSFHCLSFELHFDEEYCFVQQYTPATDPQNFEPTSSDVIYYQRHCKFSE